MLAIYRSRHRRLRPYGSLDRAAKPPMRTTLTSAILSNEDPAPGSRRPRIAEACSPRFRSIATQKLDDLMASYSRTLEPVDVSFRQLVGPLPVDDFTHSVCPYPARLLRQIPRFFLNCSQLVNTNDVVFDPFCGSGTVLVEACVAGISGWGIDSNPFARLLTQVKTTPLEAILTNGAAEEILRLAKRRRSRIIPAVVNIDYWFSKPIQGALGRLFATIQELPLTEPLRRFFLIALAITADKCSLRDRRVPVPVRRKDWEDVIDAQDASAAWCLFSSTSRFLGERVARLPFSSGAHSWVLGQDARQSGTVFTELAKHLPPPRLVLTSPPYGAAQKYIRSSALALGWTGTASSDELADLERGTIGREHLLAHEKVDLRVPIEQLDEHIRSIASRDPVRAAIYASYYREIHEALDAVVQVMAPGASMVLVAGSNFVAGEFLDTPDHILSLALALGLSPALVIRDQLRGRVLMTKRRGFSTPLARETIYLLRKPEP
jgi:hypothetical protein